MKFHLLLLSVFVWITLAPADAQKNDELNATPQQDCERGEMASCVELGNMYALGEGVERDYHTAATFYRRGCRAEMPEACHWLARLHFGGFLGGEPDLHEAAALYQQACDADFFSSCHALAGLYENGFGVPLNFELAAAMHRVLCEGGIARACSSLARLYWIGEGVPQSYPEAFALYYLSCGSGVGIACHRLGMAYADGLGIERDLVRAHAAYSVAAALGSDLTDLSAERRDAVAEMLTASQINLAQAWARRCLDAVPDCAL